MQCKKIFLSWKGNKKWIQINAWLFDYLNKSKVLALFSYLFIVKIFLVKLILLKASDNYKNKNNQPSGVALFVEASWSGHTIGCRFDP